mgnify:CR=1 FL=1
MEKFTEFHIIDCVDDITGVGHRIVQGGEYADLRKMCAEELAKMTKKKKS